MTKDPRDGSADAARARREIEQHVASLPLSVESDVMALDRAAEGLPSFAKVEADAWR